ncbi:MAG: hypothetical protein H3C31_11295 [Brumimicrobium sp.]|nr:hypothetical protein [Brumimicrobium sp.]MCO5269115.1 hypothetical protein [Brumimicrobium sp.]
MKKLITFIFLFFTVIGYGQRSNVKLVTKVSYGIYADLFSNHGVIVNSAILGIGVNFENKIGECNTYLTYSHLHHYTSILYSGHFLGISIEQSFLESQKRFRPLIGITVLSEISSNYKEGFLQGSTFITRGTHAKYPKSNGNSSSYMFNSSGFYYNTILFATFSTGFNLRIVKDLYLNFSLGYGLQIMRYKYLEWKDDEDYQEILKDIPMNKQMLHYLNTQLGLSYNFPLKSSKKSKE